MRFSEIAEMVNSTGIANVFDHFTTSPAPPYVVFYIPSENDFFADNSNYAGRADLTIELLSKSKDFESEAKIETALRTNNLTWHKTTDFLNDELIYQTTYETEVLLNG